jgi:UDP-2,3-diacylglucosamine pyrophosphatase LpxH
MWQANDVIVISDLHLARKKGGERGNGQELFQADRALEQFLTWIYNDVQDCLIILNGDIFDYLAIPLNPEAKTVVTDFLDLPERTDAIINDHPEVFDALARLANSPYHEVVITGGNHDPELIFPAVQRVIEKRLAGSSKARPLRWCVQGEALALQVGHAKALIEHGDVLDAWNRIDRSALRSAVSLASRGLLSYHRYKPPPGSRLVLDCLVGLKQDYPWVELLKPETSTVPYLLHYFLPKARLPEFKDALFHYIQAAKKHVIMELCEGLEPQQLFMGTHRELAGEEMDSALDYFKRLLNELNRQKTDFRKRSLISRLRQAASKNGFFDVSKTEAGTYKPLSFLIRSGADLLIHGHTHSAKAYKVAAKTDSGQREGLYLNSGTWARLLRLPVHDESDEVWRQFIDDLKSGQVTGFAKGFERLTFVRVRFDGKKTVAHLQEWKSGAPINLTVHSFVPEHETWARES